MDCRKALVLAVGLLGGVGGCTFPFTNPGAAPPGGAPPAAASGEEPVTHKAPTYLAFGDFRAAAGFAKEHSSAQQKQFREDARLAYLKAIEIDPKFLPAYLALGRLLQGCDDHAGAVAVFERALQINGQNAALWHELGMCQCRAKNWSTAIDSLRKACLLDANNRGYATALGYALARAGRFDESYAALRRLNGEAKAHYDLARMLRHLGQIQLAWTHAVEASQKDPRLPGVRALMDELCGKAPPEGGAVQPVSCYQPPPLPQVEAPGRYEERAGRPIRVPPLPVIPTHTAAEPPPRVVGPS
jgi:tetratricopeptide (TPR) repeat protein